MFVVVFIITILILVVIHELGHYFAAKKFNIKVLEFGFGLPPRAWGKKIGETIWSFNWLPFGGFVRLLGEDETDKSVLENERSFAAQNVWKRILVVVAGVLMNLLLAWGLFYIVIAAQNFQVKIPLIAPYKFIGVEQSKESSIFVGRVAPNSPAENVGLKSNERIYALNGQKITNVDYLIQQIKENAGKETTLTITDFQGGSEREVKVIPRENPPQNEGALGISLNGLDFAILKFEDNWQKVLSGPIHSYNIASYSYTILADTIAYSFAKKDFQPVSQSVAGPLGITNIVREILSIKNPLIPYLDFMALLSLNLAIVNILPFPGLDGGRFLFLMIEALTRKKVHETVEKYVHTVGLFILISLIILVTISDIQKTSFFSNITNLFK
jgi:regulator of sigma E protease